MAAYCAITDVNMLVPQQPFTSESVPSVDMVQQFVNLCSQELDATLQGLGYTVPVVTGTVSLNLLKWANAWGALGLAQDARGTAVLRDDMIAGAKSPWTQRFEAFKKSLQDPKNPFELYDAPRTGTAVVKPLGQLQSSTVDVPERTTYMDDPPFYMGMKL